MSHRHTYLLLALPLWLALAAPANAFCPQNSEEISRTTRGDKTFIRCRCDGVLLHYQGKCVAPEEAPLTTKALAVVTGKAFSAGAALQEYARKQNWSASAIHYWDFSTLEAKFGRYERARAFLEMARDLVKTDQVVVALDTRLANLQEYKKREFARYFQNYPEPKLKFDELPKFFNDFPGFWLDNFDKCFGECEQRANLYNRVIMEARLDRESYDYERAIAKYKDARRIANIAKFRSYYSRAANDGIIWSRQLRASREEFQNPGISAGWKSYNRIRRHDVSAARAEMLASHLSEAGQGKAAIAYLEEAGAYYQKMDPKRAPYVAEEIARLQANPRANVMGKTKDGQPLTIYTNASSQTNIMFDAVEYGKGDWLKSIKYLEAALSADPENKKIFGALNRVKGMSAAK